MDCHAVANVVAVVAVGNIGVGGNCYEWAGPGSRYTTHTPHCLEHCLVPTTTNHTPHIFYIRTLNKLIDTLIQKHSVYPIQEVCFKYILLPWFCEKGFTNQCLLIFRTPCFVYRRGSPIRSYCVWGNQRLGNSQPELAALHHPTYVLARHARLLVTTQPGPRVTSNIKTGSQQSVICPVTCEAFCSHHHRRSQIRRIFRIDQEKYFDHFCADQFQWAAPRSPGEATAASCKCFFFVITPIWWNHPGVIMT